MMKRISVLVLALVMVMSSVMCFPCAAEGESIQATSEFKLLSAIGVIDDTFDTNVPITRGIFATYVARLWGEVPQSNAASVSFYDVLADTEQCNAISLLTTQGLLNGYGDGSFLPTKPVSLQEAVKVLVDMVGYKYLANVNGGFPTGYMIAAQNLGLLKGVDTQKPYLYGDDLAILIYNALDIDVLLEDGLVKKDGKSTVSMSKEKGRTILTENLNMYKGEGVVGGNVVTNFTDEYIATNEIVVDGYKMKVNNLEYWDMVGCYVEYIYYQKPNTNERTLVYAMPEEDSILTISNTDFCGIDGLKISYMDEEGKLKKANLSEGVAFVYNGKIVSFNKTYFDNLKIGTIKLISQNGGNYDVCIIDSYQSFVIDALNPSQMKVDDGVAQQHVITFDADLYKKMVLLDVDGKEIGFDKVTKNSVISYYINDSYLKAYLSKETAEGRVQSKNSTSGTRYVVNDIAYPVPAGYLGNLTDVGESVVIYIDAFGYIAGIEKSMSDDLSVGFLLKSGSDSVGFNDKYGFKIYTPLNTVITIYAAEKIQVNGETIESKNMTPLAQSLICYKTNDAGLVTVLETPVTRENAEDGRLITVLPMTSDLSYYSGMFNSKYVFGPSTPVYFIPLITTTDDQGNEIIVSHEYTDTEINVLNRNSIEDRSSKRAEVFVLSKDDSLAKAVVIYEASQQTIPRSDNLATISTLNNVLDEKDQEVFSATVFVEGVEKQLAFADEVTGIANVSDLRPGDTFRYKTDSEGKIDMLEMVYTVADGWLYDFYNGHPASDVNVDLAYGKVIHDDGTYLRVLFDDEEFSGFMQDTYALPKSHYTNVTYIYLGSRGCTVTKGSIWDALPGDYIINYRTLMAAGGFVVIRQE